jgi:hypothetical protein
MTGWIRQFPIVAVVCLSAALAEAQTIRVEELQRAFEKPPDDARIMMRWWWFGPSVTKATLEREMRLMKEGGIGGVEVQPVYPLALDDAQTGIRNLCFLSDEFIEALRFTSEKAQELGLRLDLTLGSGWPYGGATVPVSQAAGRLRCDRVRVDGKSRRVSLPELTAGERLLAVFLEGQAPRLPELRDIRDDAVWLPAGFQGPGEVQFFIASRTGQMVKRAAVGAEGFVLNHYDRAAVENYQKNVGDRLMRALGARPPHTVFCDSLEVYGSDWTGDFLDEFRKRRGYDLRPRLPALFNDLGEETANVRHDWGQTLTELLNERFLGPMQGWARRNRTLFRVQAYGMPPAAISSNALVDLPEGEGPQWKTLSASRWASSASHLFGRPVTSSETWTWLHSPSFRATPLDVKAEADLHFLEGINQLIGHGWPYTPEGVEYPGWRLYAAAVFNEKNPWWLVMPDLSLYLQRISFLLRQGQPVSDVAFYVSNSDAWAEFSPGRVDLYRTLAGRLGPDVVARVLEAGFNLDFFDDGALEQLGRIESDALRMGANRYRIVILPGVERIPIRTLRRLEEFARAGGTLIATRRLPALAPGLLAGVAEHQAVRETSRRLFEGPTAMGRFLPDENRGLDAALASRLRPDVSLSPATPETGFVHRSAGSAEIYFLASTGNVPRRAKATFRVEDMQPEWWDPFTGRVSAAPVLARPAGGTTVALDLEPYGSRVLVFSRRTLPKPASQTAGALPAPLDLSTNWKVAFGAGGRTVTMDRLRSWTDDDETRFYSGLASYQKDVNVPDAFLGAGVELRLDFGEGTPLPATRLKSGMRAWLEAPVREAAVVYVNDRRAGSVWRPPYSVDLTGLLQRGENRLRIVVGNLAINHMAGRRLPDYRLLNLRYGTRFEPQDMDKLQAVPAGLLGPVRLLAIGNSQP